MKHRGGTRIWMVAGKRALADYRKKYENIKKISALTSTPQHETAEAIERYMTEAENQRQQLKQCRLKLAEHQGELVSATDCNLVVSLSDFSIPELIAFANVATSKTRGILVALSGVDGDYKYVISSNTVNLRDLSSDINSALSGRGGGKPNMLQGSFLTTLAAIEEYFSK
jgi:alanyl-tRNA synthetase